MKRFLIIAGILLQLFTVQQALAAGIIISPVNLAIEPGQKSTTLKLTNTTAKDMQLQLRIRAWGHGDQLSRQQRIVASPPFINIEPGQTQNVRIVNAGQPVTGNSEEAYRIFLDPINDSMMTNANGLKLQMRYALPLFVGGPAMDSRRLPDAKKLKALWSNKLSYYYNPNQNLLKIFNHANTHARLSYLRITTVDGKSKVLVKGLLGYALAREDKEFALNMSELQKSDKLIINVNGIDLQLRMNKEQ